MTRNVQNQVEHIKGKISSHENKTQQRKLQQNRKKEKTKKSEWLEELPSCAAVLARHAPTPARIPESESMQTVEDCCQVSKQVGGIDCGGEDTQEELTEGASSSHILTVAYLGQDRISGPEDVQQGDTASKHSTNENI